MKTKLCLMAFLATALSAPTCVVAADDLSTRLQKGLFEEEANRNLDAAIQAYQSVIAQFDKDRQLAATAVFRLAECYRKLGKTNDAVGQYQRLLGDFAEQTTLVNLSRQNLVGLGVTHTPSAQAPALSRSARAEQKRLLEEEIQLVEGELKALKNQFDVGVVSQEALNKKQREILALRRQLAALEDETTATPGGDAALAATDEEQKEVQRIKALIQNSPDLINARETGNYQGTPLHRAAMAGHLNVAQFLLLNGADIEATDGRNFTPLHWAANNGHKALVELLLANKAAVGGKQNTATPLHLAAANGHKLVVATLLEHKANVNARSASGWTPLHNAALYGFKAVAEVLMQHKADVNAASSLAEGQYPPGSTPLHITAAKGNLGMVEWLCANGADVNAKDSASETALHKVAGKGSKPLVGLLLAKKADVNAKNATGTTPLLIAAETPNADVVELLLEHSAEVNAQDNLRKSSLHKAVALKSEDVLKALLAAKPNLEIRDNEDFTPLQRAVLGRSDELVELLLNAGANPNVVYEQQGETPLHWAVKNGQRKAVELLLAHHANVNAQDSSGKSPLDYVKGSGANPSGGVLPPISVRTLRPSQPSQATEAIADLLRKAGASEDLQRRASIGISRSGRDVNPRLFFRGTNAHNRYRLFEAIASFYQSQDSSQRLPFPDFTRVRINRNEPQENKTKDIDIDVDTILKSGECSQDVWLEWGDLVDIPEQDHPINQQWSGLPGEISDALRKCLERNITIMVKGESTTLKLVPNVQMASRLMFGEIPVVAPRAPDAKRTSLSTSRLRETIYAAGVLRASSDVTRVTVKRTDPITKEKLELLFNLDKVDPPTDLWLRDGDVIEIPEK